MKFNFLLALILISSSAFAKDAKSIETKSDRIDHKLVQLENRVKEISQTLSLKARAPKRVEVVQDNRQEKLDAFKERLISFSEGLTQRQLFIRHEIKRSFQGVLDGQNPWDELESLERNVSFYAKAIPGLNVSAESKEYAVSEINQINSDIKSLINLKNTTAPTTTVVEETDNSELIQAGNDLLYLQSDIKSVREDMAQFAVATINNQRKTEKKSDFDAISDKAKYISLSIFFIGSVILGFVMRGKTAPRKVIVKKMVAKTAVASSNLPPLPVDMGLSNTEMEEYLNYLDVPILVINKNSEAVWGNNSSRRNSLSAAKFEELKAEGLIDSMGFPVIINNSVLYRISTTAVEHSCWNGESVTLVQLIPHEYSQIEFSSIKNKGKFITDLKSQTKEKNNINTVLVDTVDKFKYLFSESNISFDYLPLDEDAFITMKRDDLDKYCRDVIYMINRLVLDSNQKHEVILEAKLNNDRIHLKFYLMNYNYSLQPEQQEKLNTEFSSLHAIESSLSSYQGRLGLRTLKGEISSLEIDLSFNLYPVGSTYTQSLNSGATV